MKTHGLTLVELLLALLITTILTVTAMITFSHLSKKHTRESLADVLLAEFNAARLLASVHNQPVLLRPRLVNNDEGDWCAGFTVVNQKTGQVIKRFPPFPHCKRLLWRSNFGRNQGIELLGSGFTNGQQGSFFDCQPSTSPGNVGQLSCHPVVTINFSGRARRVQ